MKKGDVVFVESHGFEYSFLVKGKVVNSFDGILVGKTRNYADDSLWLVEPLLGTDEYIPMVTVKESDISEPEYPF